jgi:hypothetical protein
VRKMVNTARTVVCTIHQPSIQIFESFDEVWLGTDKLSTTRSEENLKQKGNFLSPYASTK